MEVLNYLKAYKKVNQCLFWTPLEKYNHEQELRIEAELERQKKAIGVARLHYVHHKYSLDGIQSYFSHKPSEGFYLRDLT